jgi:hypothetical protein
VTYPPASAGKPRRKLGPLAIGGLVLLALLLLCCAWQLGGYFSTVSNTAGTPSPSVSPTKAGLVEVASSPSLASASASAAVKSTEAKTQILVPDAVGLDYQSAQDLWRAAGLHVLPATDATGANRLPLVDSNWVVVSQDLPGGAMVDAGSFIKATVKKFSD